MYSIEYGSVKDFVLLSAPLTLLNAVQEFHPIGDSGWSRVEMDTIDEGVWGAVDSLASGILPELTDLPCGVVSVGGSVHGLNICFLEAELGGNLG